MKFTLDIPDGVASRVVDAMAGNYGYQATINGEPNPQTKAQFVKQKLIEFLKQNVAGYESERDSKIARDAAQEKVKTEINIT